ncbi:MAG: FIST C-terminal domain-containing protein [Deltaproteobacteria bacterium]|nr:FIST C-terminal domain-containing protein [Deltaproteobacteria bacterium]
MLLGVNDAVSPSLVIGCTTDGEISTAGFGTGSAVLGGVATDRIDFQVAAVQDLGRDPQEAGRELGKGLPAGVRHVQIFSDGLTGNGCAILRGLRSVLATNIPISGGTAGDSGRFRRTWQFVGTKVLSDSAVAVGLSGQFSLGTGVKSGWSPIGIAKKVTRASGNVLYELNGQPALEVYERFLGKHADKLPGVGVEYPFGLVDRWGDVGENDYYLLRATMSVNRREGSITFAGEIPEGALVRLTCGDYASILEAAEKAARIALEGLKVGSPVMVFFYSCMARRIVLGRRTKDEIGRIRSVFGTDLPLVGFYTYGEYCRVKCDGPSLFHNETATVTVIGT